MTQIEFVERFRVRMISAAGRPTFDDGSSIAEYAEMTGPTYFQDMPYMCESPEDCADADMSYWGEE